MSIIGGYKYPGVSGTSVPGTSITNIGAAAISGQSGTAGLMCCLYVWDYTNNKWTPMEQPATS